MNRIQAEDLKALIELFDRVKFHPLSICVLAQQLKTRTAKQLGGRLDQILSDEATSGIAVEGTSPVHGWKMLLRVEIRRNEVWLSARPVVGLVDEDVAVGLDDFQDALEQTIGQT